MAESEHFPIYINASKVSLLQSYFDFFYAKEVCNKMDLVFKKNCLGCQSFSLSQIGHTCLSLAREQQLELYFEDVLLEVDELDILKKWCEAASVIDVSTELIEMFKLKIYCKDWRETDMKTLEWKTKMIKLTVQLLLLETRFN